MGYHHSDGWWLCSGWRDGQVGSHQFSFSYISYFYLETQPSNILYYYLFPRCGLNKWIGEQLMLLQVHQHENKILVGQQILHISKVSIDSCILSLTGLNLEPFENHFEMKNHICPSDPRRGVDKWTKPLDRNCSSGRLFVIYICISSTTIPVIFLSSNISGHLFIRI